MDRVAHYVQCQADVGAVNTALMEGWVLDSAFKYNPITFEYGAIYHLCKYTEEELQALTDAALPAVQPKIVSIKSVSIDDADALIEKGYEVKELYSKTVTLVKYAATELPSTDGVMEESEK